MAVKTITIDMEAYDLLASQKRGNESFSRVIKRRLRPENTASALLRRLDDVLLDEDTLDRLEDLVAARADSLIASQPLDGSR